jgi:hypothetical protein
VGPTVVDNKLTAVADNGGGNLADDLDSRGARRKVI